MLINRPHTGGKHFLFTGVLFLFLPVLLPAQTAASLEVGASPIWNQNLKDQVLGQPFLQAESAVVASASGTIMSFYMTGTPLWNFEPNETVTPFIARSVEGATYISDASGNFRVINRIGRELWRANLGRPISHSPIVGWDGRVFIPVG